MRIISFIRAKAPRPQFSLAALFALVTVASIPMAVPIWREQAYRERLAAVSVLTDNTESYRVGVRRPDAVRDIADVGYDYQLFRAEDLDREDEISVIASDGYRVVSDEDISTISSFATLRSLDLSRCRVTDAQLADLGRLRRLERLVLDEAHVSDEGIANLGAMPSLRFLNVSRTRVADAAVEHFLSMRRLDTLYASGTNITDEGLRRLAAHTSLRVLVVGDHITDKGLVYLSEMPKLEHVSFYGAKGITSAGVARLKKLRPDLTGIWGEPLWDPSQERDRGKPDWKREVDLFLEQGSDDPELESNPLSP